MDTEAIVTALAQEPRLAVLRLLVQVGPKERPPPESVTNWDCAFFHVIPFE